MNLLHRWVCKSNWWKSYVEKDLLPWALQGIDLGNDPLEVGPGPGLTTARLSQVSSRLTALEIDSQLASSLRTKKLSGVEVIEGDATAMPFADARFTSVLSFTMLHHVPTVNLQDRLLSEAFRVLRLGGVFVGSDSCWSPLFGLAHIGDTMVLVDPDDFSSRLTKAGFGEVRIEKGKKAFRFRAAKL